MSNVYMGQITLMAITYAPRGWHVCDGSLLSISQYSALFALLGTTYGGNGTTNFALPDLRGRVPLCAGSGPGLAPYVLGQNAGTETMTLNAQNVAPHTHPATLQVSAITRSDVPPVAGNYLATNDSVAASPTPTLVGLAGTTVQPNSGGTPFSILQPYLALNFFIALQGLYPARN